MPSADGTLVFVYNADSGIANALMDLAHKVVSPSTYNCNLCALTWSPVGMRSRWKQFVGGLGRPVEFLHADELSARYGITGVPLPAVFESAGGVLSVVIDSEVLRECRTLPELMARVTNVAHATA